jgi:hypothetical protein
MTSARSILPEVTYSDGPYACAEKADALVICTEWDQFRSLDLGRMRQLMREPNLVDLRNIYDADEVVQQGFVYSSVGRPIGSSGLRRRREIVIEPMQAAKPANGAMLPSLGFAALDEEALSP